MDATFDPDSQLFGDGDSPADGSFDPFLPGLGQERDTSAEPLGDSDRHSRVSYSDSGDDEPETVIRYGKFSDSGGNLDKSDDNRPLPWEGAGSVTVSGADERRAREGADTGNRNIRRTAERHDRDTPTGTIGDRKTHSAGVDSSISAAAQRIRGELAGPVDARQRSVAIAEFAAKGHMQLGPRQYQKQGITAPPQFLNTTFEAMLMGLKANASGDWILQLKIDQDAGQLVFPLHSAFGLALDVSVTRHNNRADD